MIRVIKWYSKSKQTIEYKGSNREFAERLAKQLANKSSATILIQHDGIVKSVTK